MLPALRTLHIPLFFPPSPLPPGNTAPAGAAPLSAACPLSASRPPQHHSRFNANTLQAGFVCVFPSHDPTGAFSPALFRAGVLCDSYPRCLHLPSPGPHYRPFSRKTAVFLFSNTSNNITITTIRMHQPRYLPITLCARPSLLTHSSHLTAPGCCGARWPHATAPGASPRPRP